MEITFVTYQWPQMTPDFLPWGRIGSWPHLEHTGVSAIHIHGFMECIVCISGRLLVSVVKTHVLSSFYPFLRTIKFDCIRFWSDQGPPGSFWLFFRVCWMLNHDYGNHSLSKKQFSTTDKNVTIQLPYVTIPIILKMTQNNPLDGNVQKVWTKLPLPLWTLKFLYTKAMLVTSNWYPFSDVGDKVVEPVIKNC